MKKEANVNLKVEHTGQNLTGPQIHRGALAKADFENGKNPASWVADEGTWDKAKTAASKSYDMDDDAFWPVAAHIYENMGGEVKEGSEAARHEKSEALEAAFAVAIPETPEGEFMFMPGGVHTCDLKRAGKPLTVVVNVEKSAVTALNRQLQVVNSRSPQKAFMDFDHEKKAASFWPKDFAWREQPAPGIYVHGEWSGPGKAALEGKSYRAFSPVFHVDNPTRSSEANPAKIICEPEAALVFGALVNNPAFEKIQPLFAARAAETAGAPSAETHNQEIKEMKKTIAELQAAKTNLENDIKSLEAKKEKSELESAQLEAKRTELRNTQLEIRNTELEAKQHDRQVTDAKSAVERAVKRGALAPKATELQASWEKECTENPALIGMLDAMEGMALSGGRVTPNANGSGIQSGADYRGALKNIATIINRNAKLKLSPATATEKGKLALEAARAIKKAFKDMPDLLDAPIADTLGLEAADYSDPNSNLGVLSGTLVIQRTLQLFKYMFPLISRVYTDFSDQPGLFKQTETSRIIVVPAVQTYNATLGSDGRPLGWTTASPAQTKDVNITLDEHIGVPIVIGQDILAATVRRLFDEQSEAAMYALAKYFVAKLYKLITVANFNAYAAVTAPDTNGIVKVPTAYASFAVAAKNFARSSLVDISAAFNQNEVPMDNNRSVLLNSQYYGALSKDPSLVTFYAGQRNPEIITDNQLPKLATFAPIEAPNLPTANNIVGFALHKAGLIAKTRLPQDFVQALGVMVPGSVTTVTDPDTGISVLLVQYVNLTQGYSEWRIEALLGAAVGDNRGGLCITGS